MSSEGCMSKNANVSDKWDRRFIELARFVADWSKDPSTKVGAVIVRPDRTVAALGYNGFPRGVLDHSERYDHRPTKYEMVVHAELNSILNTRESPRVELRLWQRLPSARLPY